MYTARSYSPKFVSKHSTLYLDQTNIVVQLYFGFVAINQVFILYFSRTKDSIRKVIKWNNFQIK